MKHLHLAAGCFQKRMPGQFIRWRSGNQCERKTSRYSEAMDEVALLSFRIIPPIRLRVYDMIRLNESSENQPRLHNVASLYL